MLPPKKHQGDSSPIPRNSYDSGEKDLLLWEEAAEEYDRYISAGNTLREELLESETLELLGDVRGKKILDAGCGQGRFSAILSSHGAAVTAIDGSQKLITAANSRYLGDSNPAFSVHNLKKPLPYKDGEFDIVFSGMTLMDIDPLHETLAEFSRVLSPDGFLLFSILHPFISSGAPKKTFAEKILLRRPHLALSFYATEKKISWRITGLRGRTALYHRPISFYLNAFKNSGFLVAEAGEPVLQKNSSGDGSRFSEFCREFPLFLILKAIKGNCIARNC